MLRLSTKLALISAIAIGLLQTAQAVYISPDPQGEALILPYYGVRAGNDTLVIITNHQNLPKAVKLRLLEGENGRPVLALNLYLAPRDSWSFSLSEVEGLANLSTQDTSCTVPFISSRSFDDSALTSDPDSGTQGPERVKEGYVEIIEMGTLDTNGLGANALFPPGATNPTNCNALISAWQAGGIWRMDPQQGLFAPSGGLSAQAVFINVPGARASGYTATALRQFYRSSEPSTAALHTPPESFAPGLDAASPARSQVRVDSATGLSLVEDEWDNGLLAVSAALMAEQVHNAFSAEALPNLSSEWIVSFPTRHDLTPLGNVQAPFSVSFDDTAPSTPGLRECEYGFLDAFDRHGHAPSEPFIGLPPPGPDQEFPELCYSTNVLRFEYQDTTRILGSELQTLYNIALFDFGDIQASSSAGWASLYLDQPGSLAEHSLLNPISGRLYSGLPAVGFSVQSAQNRALNALFGVAYGHRMVPRIETPVVNASASQDGEE